MYCFFGNLMIYISLTESDFDIYVLVADSCKKFTYKGCGAPKNGNRFKTRDECMCTCGDSPTGCGK